MKNLPANKYLAGISNVFIMLLPVSLISSFSLLASNGATLFEWNYISDELKTISVLIAQLFPVLLVVFFAQYLASLYKQPVIAVITSSVLLYFIICLQWELLHKGSIIPINFPFAIIIPIVVSFIYQYLKLWSVFKDSHLPNVVERSINLVFSVSIVSSICLFISYCLEYLILEVLHLQLTMPKLNPESLVDGVIYEFIRGILWSIGINGHIILASYKIELFRITSESLALIELGMGTMPILTSNFYDFYTGMGGSGNTLSLVICVLLFAKNKGYRTLAKAALLLSIFNINEPILYGLPIMFNPIMIIPFLLAPIAGLIIAYFATLWEIVPPIMGVISWMTPPIIGGYLGTNGAISGSILQILILLIGIAIYYPFFMRMDKLSMGRTALDSLTERFFSSEKIDTTKAIGSYIPHLSINMAAQKTIEHLHKTGDFILYYQPQYDIEKQKVISLEVLIRHRSYSGFISPPSFIESFSELGLLPELDFWVLEKAIVTASLYADDPEFKISVNISPETVLVPTFLSTLTQLVNSNALNFTQLELEITEELLIKDEKETKKTLNKLRSLGITIALDDFGSGYSSIAYLSRFDFDKVKIDRSLLLNIETERGKKLFRLAVELGQITGANIVVEGAESKSEVDFIQSLGISCIQGFFFYKPMPLEEIIKLGLVKSIDDRVT
ncbi:diguanylate phosphodiesterase [Aliivibrio sp. 1S165]|nr:MULTISPECIES: EAL domain-containing protein [unclassified Aliivibrio]OCH13853.1 diguanylate phosphodiesterase [Aliivibrio sp. 1S165]OCH23828.1 diguanylate phosphodiesterase [Aliivibrio sp. 1S128]OCH31782.1 diguanylate phosphodiesterase [Aliivibrio sp. 1S175]